MSVFNYDYTGKREPDIVDVELQFEEFDGGVILKARHSSDKKYQNIAYFRKDGEIYLYPHKADSLGLDMQRPREWKDDD